MRQSIRDLVEALCAVLPLQGPVYEFGSYQCQPAALSDLRPFFDGLQYVGIDLRPGPGVDRVLDMEAAELRAVSPGVILCLDTLEHVKRPWKAVEEFERLLAPGGWALLVTVCNWPIHREPADYWRFTPDGFGLLLEESFPGSFIRTAVGDPDFPHTVAAVAWKGEVDGLSDANAVLQDWCRIHRNAP